MNETINRLIEIDKKARTIVEDAESYRDSVVANLDKDVAQFRREYIEKAEKRIGIVREEESKVSGKAMENAKASLERKLGDLNKLWQERHEQWEDELYNRCIGG